MMRGFCCLLIAGMAAIATAQVAPIPLHRTLESTSAKDLPTPGFGRSGPPACDLAGNLYFHINRGNASYNNAEIIKISRSSGEPTLFSLPPDRDTAFAAFYVSPDGVVAFATEKPDGTHIITFDSKGNAKADVHLELASPHFKPQHLGIFADDSIFVAGFFDTEAAAPAMQGKAFSGVFEPSGKLRRKLGGIQEDVDAKALSERPLEGGAAIGPDQNLYYLGPEKITVISASGELVRTIKLKKPEPAMLARSLTVREGLISVELTKTENMENGFQKLIATYVLLNADTGEVTQVLDVSNKLPNKAVCFNRADGYTFVKYVAGHLRLEFAPIL